jgi:hypothetical protein
MEGSFDPLFGRVEERESHWDLGFRIYDDTTVTTWPRLI